MTSLKQIEANRRNALKGTGTVPEKPKSARGGREGLRRIRSGCGASITVLGNERGFEAGLELLRELVGDIERAPAHCSGSPSRT
jgi:hypothetical protein